MEGPGARRRDKILKAVAFTAEAFLRGERWQESVQHALARLGDATGVSRVYVFRAHRDADGVDRVSQEFEWATAGVTSQIENPELRDVPVDAVGFRRWIDLLGRGEALHGPVRHLPAAERALLEPQEILSVAVVPIFVEGSFWGFLGFDDCGQERRWTDAEIDGLRTAAGLLGAAIYRDRAERALRDSEERFRVLVENVPGVVYLCRNDPAWSMLYLSPEVEELTGHRAERFLSGELSFVDLYHPDDAAGIFGEVESALAEERRFLLTYRLLHRDGSWRWIEERGQGVLHDDGTPPLLEGTLFDVTERRRTEEQLVHDALHDRLTDLPNRALFRDRLEGEMVRSRRRGGEGFVVAYLDLDRFKVVNDSLGHQAGDLLLEAVAERLAAELGEQETVARFGSDEFAVLLTPVGGAPEAVRRVERLQAVLGGPFRVGGREVFAHATAGLVLGDPRYETPDEMLRDADIALYRAKALGGGQRLIFDPEMHRHAVERLELESALRRALERDELVLHYQPIVSLVDGTIDVLEALVRWRHPQRGLLAPSAFLSVAQETGLLVDVGRWVLDTACHDLFEWQRTRPELGVNVNLHAVELVQPDLVDRVGRVVAESGIAPGSLTLELTEHTLLDEPAAADRLLVGLKELGVRLWLDDFGTGYSSFSYLHRLPLAGLKVDRSFIGRLEEDSEDGVEIVRGIAALGHSLGLEVIGEGVETPAQLERLRELGYDAAQGFHVARPADRELISARLAGSR
ncbi:MAG TPA: EAL domain-containing protein [Thermoanaerobaculia bacterium]|nr:EAL domain-containing protein [Thermoanaerobaculia bacterium]